MVFYGRTNLLSQHTTEMNYSEKVLKKFVAVVKFLATGRLPFLGNNVTLGSPKNANYLGWMESHFLFLSKYLQLVYGLMGKQVLLKIKSDI